MFLVVNYEPESRDLIWEGPLEQCIGQKPSRPFYGIRLAAQVPRFARYLLGISITISG